MMAWYYGTFSCGHEGRVGIIGPTKDRQRKADYRFNSICEECYKARLEQEREEANQEALEAAVEMELVELIGTEKQVTWANTLRNKIVNQLTQLREKINNNEKVVIKITLEELNVPKKGCTSEEELINRMHEYIDRAEEILLTTKTKASYWIDNRNYNLGELFEKIANEVAVDPVEKELEKELINEGTVSPIEVKYEGVVEIITTDDKIQVKYEKNDSFREIVKSLRFKWENGCWERNISEITGSAENRSAELGNKLLNAGFSISIQDVDIRVNAIKGAYEAECNRWIYFDNGKLGLKWWEKNDKLYSVSRKLPGSKWDEGKTWINISHYEKVEEFAEMYGFEFSKKAFSAIEKYKEELNNVTKVTPAKVAEFEERNGLEDILNSSRKILEDLRDED